MRAIESALISLPCSARGSGFKVIKERELGPTKPEPELEPIPTAEAAAETTIVDDRGNFDPKKDWKLEPNCLEVIFDFDPRSVIEIDFSAGNIFKK